MNRDERLDALFDECKRKTLDAIIGPFGLSYAMFADQDGGYVDTIHNVREGVYVDAAEKVKYETRPEYDSDRYHKDAAYIDRNASTDARRKKGETIEDSYSDKPIAPNDKKDLDHEVSAKENHDDPAVYLADLDPKDVANDESNLHETNSHINRSKKQMTMEEYIAYRRKKVSDLEGTIAQLEEKAKRGELSEGQKKQLENAKAAKKKYDEDGFNEEKARAADKKARKAREKKISKAYMPKFLKETGIQCAVNGAKMGFQQVIGMFLREFTEESVIQIRVILAVHRREDGDLFSRIKESFGVVQKRLMAKAKWKEILKTFGEGTFSGVVSTVVTTVVNTFATTAKRFVRAIREGIMSFVRAFQVLFIHPKEWTASQIKYEFIKLVSAAVITTIGVVIDGALQQALAGIPLGSQIASVLSTVLVGIATALACYFIDNASEKASVRAKYMEKTFSASEKFAIVYEELIRATDGYLQSVERYRESIRMNEEINNLFAWMSEGCDEMLDTVQRFAETLNESSSVRRKLLLECTKEDAFTVLSRKREW